MLNNQTNKTFGHHSFIDVTTIKEKRRRLSFLLDELSALMKVRGYWQIESPSAEALASQAPFAVDTLTFPQWLQFIFLVRFEQMITAQHPLPTAISIAPMASETLPDEPALYLVLTQIDQIVSDKHDAKNTK